MPPNTHHTWLKKEAKKWQKKSLITAHQAQSILAEYGLAKKPAPHDSSKAITALSVIGAVLVGIGVILFVASNWTLIPKPLKILLLFGTTFGTYYAGWRIKYQGKRPRVRLGGALLFLASLFVGATIFLTAQIFNVNSEAHWLVLLWFLAISPFGYKFSSKSILVLNITTFAFWLITFLNEGNHDFTAFEVFMLLMLFGISLYGTGLMHTESKKFSHFKNTYAGAGLLFILVCYFYFSLEGPYEDAFNHIQASHPVLQTFFAVFGITAVSSIVYSQIRRKKNQAIAQEFFVLLVAFLGWISLWILTFFSPELIVETVTRYKYTMYEVKEPYKTIFFILYNLILFTLSIGSILIGYYKKVHAFVNIGMVFFVLGTLHLYFTTLYEFLPRSLAFVVGGLILLGGGWYLEGKRRAITTEEKGKKMTKKEFLTSLAVPAVILVFFLAIKLSTVTFGTEITLKTAPVDPRDLFRGDYVTLRYDISQIDTNALTHRAPYFNRGEGIYARLTQKGKFWQVTSISKTKPSVESGEVCMSGTVTSGSDNLLNVEWGIESYFVPEGEGLEIERAPSENVHAKVMVDDDCSAVLRDLVVNGVSTKYQ